MILHTSTQELAYIMNGLLLSKQQMSEGLAHAQREKDKELIKYFEARLLECDTVIHKVKACYRNGKTRGRK